MATLRFILRSKTKSANIYMRYSINGHQTFYRKTGYIIDHAQWNAEKQEPNQKTSASNKALKIKLDKLATFINEAYNLSISNGEVITADWLQLQANLFNNTTQAVELDLLTNYIQKYIDESPLKRNAKGGTGLSEGRVQNIKLFKKTIQRYQKEVLKDKPILIKNINLQFTEQFKNWLLLQKYSVNYVGKNIDN